MDYDRNFSFREVQLQWFQAQIQLAEEEKLPLFLHEQAAFHDFKKILAAHPIAASCSVVHCFTGTQTELETYLELGCMIGITGWLCDERRGTALRQIVKLIPKERLMIEN